MNDVSTRGCKKSALKKFGPVGSTADCGASHWPVGTLLDRSGAWMEGCGVMPWEPSCKLSSDRCASMLIFGDDVVNLSIL